MNDKKLKIGDIELSSNVILAPMAGVTDFPYRKLVKSFGCGLTVSEMVASNAVISQKCQVKKMREELKDEKPISVQVAGYDENIMLQAAKMMQDLGADIIDINMGCPVKKIVKNEAGSALMKDINKARKIVETLVNNLDVPVTLKIRTGWEKTNRNGIEFAKMAEECGVKMLTVHGRTRNDFYSGEADWDYIKQIKEAVSIPVIGNGDITDIYTAKKRLEESGVDGIMVGRGIYGKPWLIHQIEAYLEDGTIIPDPSLNEQRDILLKLIDSLADYYGQEKAVLLARKHVSWFTKGKRKSNEFRQEVNRTKVFSELLEKISDFYEGLKEDDE
ncbi:MAG: tRNA dihydrouridine synthase DusB [Alphaproteobacteria bacterium]|jgi:tRNA-dihydrouridine synthase B|nr:tRNA dihydrouridine synthase DusB [Alphaproteobacteria bacterium]